MPPILAGQRHNKAHPRLEFINSAARHFATWVSTAQAGQLDPRMDLTKLPLFSMMAKRLSWLGQRQQVLANNVANTDTPGYRARDLKDLSFKQMLGGEGGKLTMAATTPAHLSGPGEKPAAHTVEKVDSHEIVVSGNSVSLEEEMMKVGKTMMDYQLTTNLYRKHILMIKTALGRGNT